MKKIRIVKFSIFYSDSLPVSTPPQIDLSVENAEHLDTRLQQWNFVYNDVQFHEQWRRCGRRRTQHAFCIRWSWLWRKGWSTTHIDPIGVEWSHFTSWFVTREGPTSRTKVTNGNLCTIMFKFMKSEDNVEEENTKIFSKIFISPFLHFYLGDLIPKKCLLF